MKIVSTLLALVLVIFPMSAAFSQQADHKTMALSVQNSKVEADQNMARLVIEGDVSYLDRSHPLDFISLGLLQHKDLRLLRNTIYARYGYRFHAKDLRSHFSRFGWYKPSKHAVEDELNTVDRRNLEMIDSFEKMEDEGAPVVAKSDIVGLWHSSLLMPSGFDRAFQFYRDGRFVFRYSQMRELPLIESFSGEYAVKGNVLHLVSTARKIIRHSPDTTSSGAFGLQWKKASVPTETYHKQYRFPLRPIQRVGNIEELKGTLPEEMVERIAIGIGAVRFFKYTTLPDNHN